LQGALLRTHAKAERPGSVVLPMDERVFNPSRQTRHILRQAEQIGQHASRLCALMFAAEGRVGQKKLWGIVGLTKRYPAVCVDSACAQALEEGVYSYKHVQTLAERLFVDAMAAMDEAANDGHDGGGGNGGSGGSGGSGGGAGDRVHADPLAQQHALIRQGDEYADLFTRAAMVASAAVSRAMDAAQGDLRGQGGQS
jgi:hypothetical protein